MILCASIYKTTGILGFKSGSTAAHQSQIIETWGHNDYTCKVLTTPQLASDEIKIVAPVQADLSSSRGSHHPHNVSNNQHTYIESKTIKIHQLPKEIKKLILLLEFSPTAFLNHSIFSAITDTSACPITQEGIHPIDGTLTSQSVFYAGSKSFGNRTADPPHSTSPLPTSAWHQR